MTTHFYRDRLVKISVKEERKTPVRYPVCVEVKRPYLERECSSKAQGGDGLLWNTWARCPLLHVHVTLDLAEVVMTRMRVLGPGWP